MIAWRKKTIFKFWKKVWNNFNLMIYRWFFLGDNRNFYFEEINKLNENLPKSSEDKFYLLYGKDIFEKINFKVNFLEWIC